jgi:hypothetical protein
LLNSPGPVLPNLFLQQKSKHSGKYFLRVISQKMAQMLTEQFNFSARNCSDQM